MDRTFYALAFQQASTKHAPLWQIADTRTNQLRQELERKTHFKQHASWLVAEYSTFLPQVL